MYAYNWVARVRVCWRTPNEKNKNKTYMQFTMNEEKQNDTYGCEWIYIIYTHIHIHTHNDWEQNLNRYMNEILEKEILSVCVCLCGCE